MAQQAAWAFLDVLACFGPALSLAQWQRFVVLAAGWTLTTGRHAVTQALVETGVAGKLHHEAFHRLFSRGRWHTDTLGHLLFIALRRFFSLELSFVIDDSLARKKGPQIYGIACHLDPVSSTRNHRNFVFGHCWVILSLRVRLPFSSRTWALPLLFRLYLPPSVEERGENPSKTKSQLARELLEVVLSWCGDEPVSLAVDNGYCTKEVLKELPRNVTVEGAFKSSSVLYAPVTPRRPGQRGRPASKGERLGTIAELAGSTRFPWQKRTVYLDGKQSTVWVKTFLGMWPTACPHRVLRIVIVKCETGDREFRAFFSTEPDKSAEAVLEGYSGRWSTEVTFHDAKQLLGLGQSSARKPKAVERTLPFVGLLYSSLVLWYAQYMQSSPLAAWPVRPWYRHKVNVSFEDILRTARRALGAVDISEMLRLDLSVAEIRRTPPRPRTRVA